MAPSRPSTRRAPDEERADLYRLLVDFQVARLKDTYDDFRRNPRFRLLAHFFFDDVYSTQNKRERDDQFRRLYDLFRRRLGERLTRAIGELVALNELSNELDRRMVKALARARAGPGPLSDRQYEDVYRACDCHAERVTQIVTLCRCIRLFHAFGQHALIGLALKAVKAGAGLFGGKVVIGFLDRGYHAYRSVTTEEIDVFERAVRGRELERNDRIYGKGAAAPP